MSVLELRIARTVSLQTSEAKPKLLNGSGGDRRGIDSHLRVHDDVGQAILHSLLNGLVIRVPEAPQLVANKEGGLMANSDVL